MIEKLGSYNSSRTSKDGYHWEFRPNLEDIINKINEIIDVVNVPIVEVKSIKHGHWIDHQYKKYPIGRYECSMCGAAHDMEWGYCPNCGAKMDEEEQDNGSF